MLINFQGKFFFAILLLFTLEADAGYLIPATITEIPRRRPAFNHDFSYFVYPVAGRVPGLGNSSGVGGTFVNIFDTDTDISGFILNGDFDASGIVFLNIHLIPEFLIFDFGNYYARVAAKQFKRGIHSDVEDYILPNVVGNYTVGQLTLSLFERRVELYTRYLGGTFLIENVLDKNGNSYANINNQKVSILGYNIGSSFDLTDDKQDPRQGFRVEGNLSWYPRSDALQSQTKTLDLNFTKYLLMRKLDSLVFNVFLSRAFIDQQATTNADELRSQIGLQCTSLPDSPEKNECLKIEDQLVNDRIAENKYGQSTPIGGVQRLRSFQSNRFYAGNSLSYGAEYRWNITDERTLFDFYMMRGIRTGIQLAFFIEQGTVADEFSELIKQTKKTTLGTGFRLVLSGITLRLDAGIGDEGFDMQVFLDYPWSLFSVDKP